MISQTTDVQISYDDRGEGDLAMLCLPGWCGDRSVFTPLLDSFAPHRRAMAIDWRGHGSSTREVADFGNAELVEDALHVIEQSGVSQVVPVALSHAGWVAVELRRRLGPGRVPGIVLVDWMVLGTPPGFTDALAGLQDANVWQQVRGGLFDMWTTGVDSRAVIDYVQSMGEYGFEHWARAGREIAAAFDRDGTPVEALQVLADEGQPCPTLHAYAQPSDPPFLEAQQAYAAAHPWFTAQQLDARSHFPTLEIPDAVSDLVDDFVSSLAAGQAKRTAVA